MVMLVNPSGDPHDDVGDAHMACCIVDDRGYNCLSANGFDGWNVAPEGMQAYFYVRPVGVLDLLIDSMVFVCYFRIGFLDWGFEFAMFLCCSTGHGFCFFRLLHTSDPC